MRLKDVEAVSPNPRLLDADVRMSIVDDCVTVFIDKDLEVAVRSGAVVGLDEAARFGHVVTFTGDSWSSNPRPKVVVGIIAKPMPQLLAMYDDCLKITVVVTSEVGLHETDINPGHPNSPFQSQ